jgi:hypothetical protein
MGVVHRITHILYFLFIYVFVFEVKIYSHPVKQTKIIFYQKKRKKNRRFPPEIETFVFGDNTIHHLACTAPLGLLGCQRQSSNSFYAANLLSRSTISVSNGFPNGS